MFECYYCHKKYKTHAQFRYHLILCEISYKEMTNNTREYDYLPTNDEMFGILKMLVRKVNTQEKKINKLESYIKRKKVKIKALEWLNTYKIPDDTYENWKNNLLINENTLKTIFESTFVKTMINTFKSYVLNTSIIPIVYLNNCKNCYIFVDKQWKQTTDVLNNWIKESHTSLLILFKNWTCSIGNNK